MFSSLFPKPQDAVSGNPMPDQLHSETELCELLVFVLLANEQEVLHGSTHLSVEQGLA